MEQITTEPAQNSDALNAGPEPMTNKAVFLDRDGVINVDHGYVYRKEDFEFVDGIFDLCWQFQEQGYLIIVVTNQSGIARGLYTEEQFQALTDWMVERFREQGIEITMVYHCPHHPDFGPNETRECECRKPKPGMILDGASEFNIDLEKSIMIGDKPSDQEAAMNAGIKHIYIVTNADRLKRITSKPDVR